VGLFIGTHTQKVDKKGRVSVPAAFRSAVARAQGTDAQPSTTLMLLPTMDQIALEAFGPSAMQDMHRKLELMPMFSEDREILEAWLFGEATEVNFDGEGRMVLPQHLRDQAEITDAVVFVGMSGRMRLWSPDHHAAFQAASRALRSKKRLSLPVLNGGGGS